MMLYTGSIFPLMKPLQRNSLPVIVYLSNNLKMYLFPYFGYFFKYVLFNEPNDAEHLLLPYHFFLEK